MPTSAESAAVGPETFIRALRDPGRNLRDKYRGKPLELAEKLGLKLPRKPVLVMIELGVITEEEAKERFGEALPGFREFVFDVCTLQEHSVVCVACRGGGKSFGVSFVEFYLWIIMDFDALNLGGSELQADQVYRYMLGYIEADPYWSSLLRGDPQRERTYTKEDSWVRVLAASSKSVRSPHAGGYRKGKVRGGILVIDEEAECDADIVEAALPTINTAQPSVNARVSTFHNVEGSFQEVVDHHEEMGYKLYKWDIFDVAQPCDCVGGCQSEEVCFREDHIENYVDPEDGEEKERLIHRAYCGGRGMYASGWIPQAEIVKLWKRMKRNHSRWEVEAMGSRPSSAGYVIKDLTKFAANFSSEIGANLYKPGGAVTICVDWGSTAAGVGVWQEQPFGKCVLLHADLLLNNNETQILGAVLAYAQVYQRDLLEIAADIGGGGNYLNKKLRQEHRLPVRDVNFNVEKEAAAAAWNILNEAGDCVYGADATDFASQVRNWKRKLARIVKHNDHLCDMSLCFFAKFIDQMGLNNIRIQPRSFRTNSDISETAVETPTRQPGTRPQTRSRLPIARSLGRPR